MKNFGKQLPISLVIAALALAALTQSSVLAIQFGEPDSENRYPYVGLVVFYTTDENGNLIPLWRCSGAQIAPRVFLTAGHCAGYDPDLDITPTHAQVWFEVGPIELDPNWESGEPCTPDVTGYPCGGGVIGTPIAHPEWTGRLTIPDTHDVGLVIFDEDIILPEYGKLAPEGYLDALATRRGLQEVHFTVVGYGLQSVRPFLQAERTRYVGEVMLIDLRSALNDGYNIQYTNDPGLGTGSGGTCFGDSGGPVIHKTSTGEEVIVGVNSFVLNANCMGSAFAYRVDTQHARYFLANYVELP